MDKTTRQYYFVHFRQSLPPRVERGPPSLRRIRAYCSPLFMHAEGTAYVSASNKIHMNNNSLATWLPQMELILHRHSYSKCVFFAMFYLQRTALFHYCRPFGVQRYWLASNHNTPKGRRAAPLCGRRDWRRKIWNKDILLTVELL